MSFAMFSQSTLPQRSPVEAAVLGHFYVHLQWAVRCSRGPEFNPAIVDAGGQACAIYPNRHGIWRSPISGGSLDPGSTLGGCPVEGPTASVADIQGYARGTPATRAVVPSWVAQRPW